MSFIEAYARLRICFFRYVITVLWARMFSKTYRFITFLTLLLLTMASVQPCLLLTNSSFPLRLSE